MVIGISHFFLIYDNDPISNQRVHFGHYLVLHAIISDR